MIADELWIPKQRKQSASFNCAQDENSLENLSKLMARPMTSLKEEVKVAR